MKLRSSVARSMRRLGLGSLVDLGCLRHAVGAPMYARHGKAVPKATEDGTSIVTPVVAAPSSKFVREEPASPGFASHPPDPVPMPPKPRATTSSDPRLAATAPDLPIASMLPSLGFFGGAWADCLQLPFDGKIASIEITRARPTPGFLNLRGVLLMMGGRIVPVPMSETRIEQSSSRSESGLSPQGLGELVGIHTDYEDRSWWRASVTEPVEVDTVVVFNRADGFGHRSRSLAIRAVDATGSSSLLYDAASTEHVRSTFATIERLAGRSLNPSHVSSVAQARKWRTDAVAAVCGALKGGAQVPSRQDWLYIAALLPSAPSHDLGMRLEGNDWFLLAYGLIAQVFRDPRSRSGFRSYGMVLDSRSRLERLEAEFGEVCSLLGVAPMQLVRHGISPIGELEDSMPQIGQLVDRLIVDLAEAGSRVQLARGSLLGAVRERRVIAHDDDLDVFMTVEAPTQEAFESKRAEILQMLKSRGWIVLPNPPYFNAHVSRPGSQVHLDLFGLWLHGERATTHMEKMMWRDMPRAWFEGESTVEIEGLTLPAPSDPEAFLNERYGPTWRIPDKYDDWRWPLDGEGH